MIDVAKIADLASIENLIIIFFLNVQPYMYIARFSKLIIIDFPDIYECLFQVLLLIDASFGFEMEIFEFLNICQVHGFPKIMGVLTHLDLLKNNKALKKTKKKLKTRFWTEVYQVIKMSLICVLFLLLLLLTCVNTNFASFPGNGALLQSINQSRTCHCTV